MKLTAVILLSTSLTISARTISQTVTLDMKNAPVQKIFREVIRQTGVSIIYNEALFKTAAPITIKVDRAPIATVLDICIRHQGLEYSIENNTIVIHSPAPRISSDISDLPLPVLIDVRGRVINQSGEPIIKASVIVKSTQQGTSTDDDGYFELKGIDEHSILLITSVNTQPREVAVNGNSFLRIVVELKISENDAVTVNAGYYQVKDRERTGDISRVTAAAIERQPVSNVLAALEGRIPGVFIQQNSGIAGGSFNILIRGQNSLRNSYSNNGNRPLYLIDGVPFSTTPLASSNGPIVDGGNPLSAINPNDIESIEVLKDADATAIYGSRGANGVVLITTKRGKTGKESVDATVYQGFSSVPNMMKLLNTEQYITMRHEAFQNDGATPGTYANDYDILKWDQHRYTDWQKVLIGGTAAITNAQVSFYGGNDRTRLLLGSDYSRETTVFPGDLADKKISTHLHISHSSLNDKLKIDFSSYYLQDNNQLMRIDLTRTALLLAPNAPLLYTADGSLNWENSTWTNPLSVTRQAFNAKTSNLINNSVISFAIAHGLELKSNLGYSELHYDEFTGQPQSSYNPAQNSSSSSTFSNRTITTALAEPQLAYKGKSGIIKYDALLGGTLQSNTQNGKVISATGFSSDALLNNVQAASSIRISSIDQIKYHYAALFARINFNVADKYFINLTGRRDASSRFGSNNRLANFGAAGMSWLFTKEKFFQQHLSFLSFGKLRGSYGITGSDQIGDYGFYDLWNTTSYSYAGSTGLAPANLLNPEYGWEVNKKLEFALDLAFFHNRLSVSINYYRNRSGNQLVGIPLPYTTGFPNVQSNLPALVLNTGTEITSQVVLIQKKNFTWTSSVNVTIPENKLLRYPNIKNSSYASTYIVGKSLFVVPSYHYTGTDPQTGVYGFEDVNHDGYLSIDDYQGLKKVAPQFYGGIEQSLSYKNFQFDFFFQFNKQTGRNYLAYFNTEPGMQSNQPAFVMNRWQHTGDNSPIQKFSENYGTAYQGYSYAGNSDLGFSDASFIKLKNISLSYKLPDNIIHHTGMQGASLFFRGENVFTITNYKGLDPETQTASLPTLRTLTGGIHITF